MAKIIGIDLGTTNSEAAYMEGGRPRIIPSAEGSAYGGKMFPSVVAFTRDGILVGQPAKRQAVLNPDRTVMQIKRKMGTDHKVRIDGKDYTPQEISAMILRKIKTDAEAFLGQPINRAVITVPAYFNDAQRQATKDAGKIAGLGVLRLVNEPTAAALAYGLHEKQRGKVAVYDLGGGTFDISILKLISTNDGDIYQVLSTNGDTHLGGDDIDNLLQAFVQELILQQDEIDFSPHGELAQELRKSLISLKHQLSEAETATLRFPLPNGSVFVREFTRGEFEALIRPIVDRTIVPIKQSLADAQLKPADIEEAVLVGGTTRTPLVRR